MADSLVQGREIRKQSVYFTAEMLAEITAEAGRLDRTLSWIVQRVWKLARKEVKKMPAA
jgi:uncharacterized small protein (TIGR04563 family)